jgi:hypothetical protein
MLVPYYRVKNIRFDFTGSEDEVTIEEQTNINDDYTNTFWLGKDEDEVVENITNSAGWCVSAIELETAEVEVFL